MEPVYVIVSAIAAFIGLEIAFINWGADSRDRYPDDHTRGSGPRW